MEQIVGIKKNKLDDKEMFAYDKISTNLPFLFFLALIAMLYIANSHYAEKNIRELNKISQEIKELRWEYMTEKSDLMCQSKQSEVSKKVEELGLKELVTPPQKIVIKNGN